jgi:hypothetical protein
MATPFENIYDLALVSFRDWTLDKLYDVDPASFESLMQGLLLKAIPNFADCQNDLYVYSLTTKEFTANLDLDEQVILSNYLVLEWMESQINDKRQQGLLLGDNDFKHSSEATVANAKTNTRDKFREENERKRYRYALKNTNWDNLISGNYYE